jgi:hypothetical protein
MASLAEAADTLGRAARQVPLAAQAAALFRRLRGEVTVSEVARRLPPGRPQRSTRCTCEHQRGQHRQGRYGTARAPRGGCSVHACECRCYQRVPASGDGQAAHATRQWVLALEDTVEPTNLTLGQMERLGASTYGVGFRLYAYDLATGEVLEGTAPRLRQPMRREVAVEYTGENRLAAQCMVCLDGYEGPAGSPYYAWWERHAHQPVDG